MEVRRLFLALAALIPGLSSCIYLPEVPEEPVVVEPFSMTVECALQGSLAANFTSYISGGERLFVKGGFYYGTDPGFSDAIRVPSLVVDGKMTASVANLETEKTYYVKAYVTDRDGTLESNTVSFDSACFGIGDHDFVIPYTGGSFDIGIKTNLDYYFDIGRNYWISYDVTTRATENFSHVFVVEPNTDFYSRSARIVASSADGYLYYEITVFQGGSPIQFTDAGFKSFMLSKFDANHDGEIDIDETAPVTELDFCTDGIVSLSDLQFFPNITSLKARGSEAGKGALATIDLSTLPALKTLDLANNALTSIDLTNNPEITYIDLSSNALTDIDLSSMQLLETFNCCDNSIKTINLGRNTSLKNFFCDRNGMEAIHGNISSALQVLSCNENALTSLDVSNNRGLLKLLCDKNALTELTLSANTALTDISCRNNDMKELYLRRNANIVNIDCDSNPIESISVGDPSHVKHLSCRDCQIRELDLDKYVSLEYIDVTSCPISVLDVSNSPNIREIYCNSLSMKILYVAKSHNIKGVTYGRDEKYINSVTSVYNHEDVAVVSDPVFKAYLLKHFDSDHNGKLTIDECEQIEFIQISTDDVSSLDGIEFFSNLKSLQCSGSSKADGSSNGLLTKLDVSKNGHLEYLVCNSNRISRLDVSNNPLIKSIWCANNNLTSLNLETNINLNELYCERNQIKELDLTTCPNLEMLDCSPMNDSFGSCTLKTVKLAEVVIPFINGEGKNARNTSNIPTVTELYVNGMIVPQE